MGELGRERGHADRDVIGAVHAGRVPHPFPGVGQYGLTGVYFRAAALVLDDDASRLHRVVDQPHHAPSVGRQRRTPSGAARRATMGQSTRSITSGSRSGREPRGAIWYAPSSAASARSKRSGSSVCSVSSGSPARTNAPGFACISMPAPACTPSSLRARPAPSRHAAIPTPYASRLVRTPSAGTRTVCFSKGALERFGDVEELDGIIVTDTV